MELFIKMPLIKAIQKKLFTRLIWYWERQRPYPLLKKIWEQSPLESDLNSSWKLVLLSTEETIVEAMWSAYSIITSIRSRPEIVFYIDGRIDEEEKRKISKLFPHAKIKLSHEIIDQIPEQYLFLKKAAQTNSSARKLAIPAIESEDRAVLYSDSDILFFKRPVELEESIRTGNGVWHVNAYEGIRGDVRLLNVFRETNTPFLDQYNSGLFFLSKGKLQLDQIEPWLNPKNCDPNAWFIDQTVLAALLKALDSKLLPMEEYVVSCNRQFYFQKDHDYSKIVMRHFMGPVRHLMYLKGIPVVLKNLGKNHVL